jgi:hypothetical protein
MESDANESLLSFDVSVPKPLGKISFTSTFDAATQIHYRPSIVLLSDIISDENVRSITSNTTGSSYYRISVLFYRTGEFLNFFVRSSRAPGRR